MGLHPRIRIVPALLALALMLVPAASADAARSKGKPRAFKSCGDLVRYARSHARDIVQPWGVPALGETWSPPPPPTEGTAPQTGGGDGTGGGGGGGGGGTDGPNADDGFSAPATGVPGTDFSGTNVQEEGVDEPDSVKTDGRILYVAEYRVILAYDVSSGAPQLVGKLELEAYGTQLLLHGQKLIAISQPGEQAAPNVATVIREIDVSNPAHMRTTRIMQVEGNYVGARLTGGTARIAISSSPDYEIPPAPEGGLPETAAQATERIRRGVKRTKVRGWRPSYKLVNRKTKKRAWRALVPCDQVRRLGDFSGLGMLTVLTIDVERGLPPVDADALYADAHTVYASRDALYLATERWVDGDVQADDVPTGSATTIHKLSTTDAGSTEYRATGEVRGYLLSQWSLSEKDGKLRVASTDTPSWLIDDDDEATSESFVTVLDEQNGALRQVGRVGGLGKGEQIYAVRFIGDQGYVVTFRQTDPLYVVDVSDPTNPRVRGELKILGYSAYLHPVGENLLLGVGQDATKDGVTLGVQLSLFDVSDPAKPRRLSHHTLAGDSYSDAEWDHHAFLYWPATQTAVIPVDQYDDNDNEFLGAAGFRVDREDGITPIGRIAHSDPQDPDYEYDGYISRAIVVGDRLYTVSDAGVKASRLQDLADIGYTPFEENYGEL